MFRFKKHFGPKHVLVLFPAVVLVVLGVVLELVEAGAKPVLLPVRKKPPPRPPKPQPGKGLKYISAQYNFQP